MLVLIKLNMPGKAAWEENHVKRIAVICRKSFVMLRCDILQCIGKISTKHKKLSSTFSNFLDLAGQSKRDDDPPVQLNTLLFFGDAIICEQSDTDFRSCD